MAKVNWRLAQGGSISAGITGKLPVTGGIVDSSSVVSGINSGIRPISLNAGQVHTSPMAVPKISVSNLGQEIANTTNTLVDAAFKYQDRLDQIEADEGVIAGKKLLREVNQGRSDDKSNFIPGYLSLEAKNAVEAFPAYRKSIDEAFAISMDGKSDSVKGKMLIRMQQAKETALSQGTSHMQNQVKVQEMYTRFNENQDILKDIASDGVAPFLNGTISGHLAKYTNPQQRLAAEDHLVKQAMYTTYNQTIDKAYKNTLDLTPAVTAYKASENAFNAIRKTLSPEVAVSADHWLLQQKRIAIAQAKAARSANLARFQNVIRRSAPNEIAETIVNGNWGLIDPAIKTLRRAFKNVNTGSNEALNALKGGIDTAIEQGGGVTVTDKTEYAASVLNHILVNAPNLDAVERVKLRNYVFDSIPSRLIRRQRTEDHLSLAQAERVWMEGKDPGQAPANMLVESQNKWEDLRRNYTGKDMSPKGPISGVHKDAARGIMDTMKAQLRREQPLTNTQLNKIYKMSSDKLIPEGEYSMMVQQNQQISSGKLKAPSFAKTIEFKAANARLKRIAPLLAGVKPIAAPTASNWSADKAKKYDDYTSVVNEQYSKVYNAMFDAAKDAAKSGKKFEPGEWLDNYIKTEVNHNSILNRSLWGYAREFLNMLFDPEDIKNQIHDDWNEARADAGVSYHNMKHFFTGEY